MGLPQWGGYHQADLLAFISLKAIALQSISRFRVTPLFFKNPLHDWSLGISRHAPFFRDAARPAALQSLSGFRFIPSNTSRATRPRL
jgi:hypothetical protein